jgi:hypothetical protein
MAEKDGKDIFKYLYLAIGSLLIALSSGYGLVAGFHDDFSSVYLGLIGFVSGYKVAQIGIHNGRESSNIFLEYYNRMKSYSRIDSLSFIGGSLMMALGFLTLSQAIVTIKISMAAAAAVSMGAGYMVCHWAINNTLV